MEINPDRLKVMALAIGLAFQSLLLSAAQSPEVAHFQFWGGNQMAADANMPKFKQIWGLPSTIEYRAVIAHKVAIELSSSFAKELNPAMPDAAPLLSPLVEDVFQYESAATFGGRTNGPLGFVLAVKLDNTRVKVWQDTFARLIGSAPEKSTAESFECLNWKKAKVRLVRAQDWLVVSRGEDLLPRQTQYLQLIRQQGHPTKGVQENWLVADADWPRLAAWLPLNSCPFKLAYMDLKISAKKDIQKTKLRLVYPEKIQWKNRSWRVPMEAITDPVVSFTAMQDVAPFLQENKNLSKLRLNPLNQEVYVWALRDVPFLTFGAIMTDHATNVLRDLAVQVPQIYNGKLNEMHYGQLAAMANGNELAWTNLSFIIPTLSAKSGKSGEFIELGFFPQPPHRIAPPDELFAQFTTRTNLVYYDWEYTGIRLQQWRPLSVILPILRGTVHPKENKTATHKAPATTAAKGKKPNIRVLPARERWLTDIVPLLNDTVTEAVLTGPNELTISRNSHLGFTGLELVALSYWLDDDASSLAQPMKAQPRLIKPAHP